MDDSTFPSLHAAAGVLNGIFDEACRHLCAHPTSYAGYPALRIVNRSVPLASPHADLVGQDRRRLGSAFLKAGLYVAESPALVLQRNEPGLLFEVYTPPLDMLWVVQHNHVNPWSAHVLRPDHGLFAQLAPALSEALRLRYS